MKEITIEETNINNKKLQDWLIEENVRWCYAEDIGWSKKWYGNKIKASKTKEVIINMLKKKIDTISEVTVKTINVTFKVMSFVFRLIYYKIYK